MDIVLASQSPRRRELLKKIVPEFRVVPSGLDEEKFREKDPLRFALRAAEAKAREAAGKNPASLVIAADTVVNVGDEVLGKPEDRAQAEGMLRKLSGKRHRVITAVALYRKDLDMLLTGYEISYVTFKPLTDRDIEDYLASSEYLDKAGSYAVQEIGDAFVERLEGDYENVVGFPVARVKKLLDDFRSAGDTISIVDLALPHDWGVGKSGGLVTFVPGAVVGDRVRVIVSKAKRRLRYGKIVGFEEHSPFRVEPKCPHFGVCGGCSFQNLDYTKQLEIKEGYLLRTIQKIGRLSLDEVEREPISASPSEYYYRGKMEYAFGSDGGGVFLGLRERASPLERYKKRTVALRICPIFSRTVDSLFPILLDFAGRTGWDAYDPISRTGYFRNLVLRESKNTGQILAVLVTKAGRKPDLEETFRKLEKDVPQVRSFWWVENERVSDMSITQAKRTSREGLLSKSAWKAFVLGSIRRPSSSPTLEELRRSMPGSPPRREPWGPARCSAFTAAPARLSCPSPEEPGRSSGSIRRARTSPRPGKMPPSTASATAGSSKGAWKTSSRRNP
jgi:MAF protein